MTIGEWLALIGLIFVFFGGLAAIGGFIWWAGGQHRDLSAAIEANSKLQKSIDKLTTATTAATTEMQLFQTKMDSWRAHVDQQHEDIWTEIGKLRDRR